MPPATPILDRFLHYVDVITVTGKSYHLPRKKAPKPTATEKGENCGGRKK
jgi:hypothetical protein